ncbi:Mob2p ASCRUDRAFT_75872 [Ascoidea rubescens DSM 1968]|uniref:Mob1/phocein n=1 Tax=Ascoidea rubescens DSM 1968 TaxID=1344418 RepID=A0A1D2VI50_9ASCO|nr:hypothetical protein ASCRUDRAFT_75872 [Ascoidea rubescens DSM 1968]ODV61157.1 hypothetical protein ASCRUDRAFT_75872 [Ascoidea rubescens DSM 1968]
MSFFQSIRGFTSRTSKKNKNPQSPQASNINFNASSLNNINNPNNNLISSNTFSSVNSSSLNNARGQPTRNNNFPISSNASMLTSNSSNNNSSYNNISTTQTSNSQYSNSNQNIPPNNNNQNSTQLVNLLNNNNGGSFAINNCMTNGVIDLNDPPLFLCDPFLRSAVVKGSFKTIVQLPKYVEYKEWLALNVFELFTNLNQFCDIIIDLLQPDIINSTPNNNVQVVTFYHVDPFTNQSVNLPSKKYMEFALNVINEKINDQSVFPTKNAIPFATSFMKDCKKCLSEMLKIFGHIYFNHFDKIIHLSLEAHFNSFFSHFISFINEFDLVDKHELVLLNPLIKSLEKQGKISYPNPGDLEFYQSQQAN